MDTTSFKKMLVSTEIEAYKSSRIDYSRVPKMPILEKAETAEIINSDLIEATKLQDLVNNWEWEELEDPYPSNYHASLALWNMYVDGVINEYWNVRCATYFFVFIDDTPYIAIAKK